MQSEMGMGWINRLIDCSKKILIQSTRELRVRGSDGLETLDQGFSHFDQRTIAIPHLSCAVGGARACLSFYLGAALKRADLANCFDQLRTGLDRNLFVSRGCT